MLTLILKCANVLLVINKLSSEPNKCCINVSMDATLLLLLFCLALTASPVHLVSVFDVIIDQCLPHAKFYYISLEEAGQQEDDLSVSRILESSARFRSRFVRFNERLVQDIFLPTAYPNLPIPTYLCLPIYLTTDLSTYRCSQLPLSIYLCPPYFLCLPTNLYLSLYISI